jgi:hypothetical protein
LFDFGKNYIEFRWIFSVFWLSATGILYLSRGWIYRSYRFHPQRRRFLKSLQPLLPPIGTLFFSYWLSHTKETFLPAAFFLVLPFFSFYYFYWFFLSVGEDLLGADIETFRVQINKMSQIVALEEYMQKLIKSKATRFLEFYTKLISTPPTAAVSLNPHVFDTITQPKQQISTLVILIQEYFKKHIVPDPYQCNVTVMAPEGDKLKFVYFHEPPRSKDLDIFEYGKTAAGKSWSTGNMIIIPDKSKEFELEASRRIYEVGGRDFRDDKGSLICFPVFDYDLSPDRRKALIYVVNITSTMPGNFLFEDEPHYRRIMNSLAERIRLENRLLKIKELIVK